MLTSTSRCSAGLPRSKPGACRRCRAGWAFGDWGLGRHRGVEVGMADSFVPASFPGGLSGRAPIRQRTRKWRTAQCLHRVVPPRSAVSAASNEAIASASGGRLRQARPSAACTSARPARHPFWLAGMRPRRRSILPSARRPGWRQPQVGSQVVEVRRPVRGQWRRASGWAWCRPVAMEAEIRIAVALVERRCSSGKRSQTSSRAMRTASRRFRRPACRDKRWRRRLCPARSSAAQPAAMTAAPMAMNSSPRLAAGRGDQWDGRHRRGEGKQQLMKASSGT